MSGLAAGQEEAALHETFHRKAEDDDDDDDSSDETASACSATESVLESLFRKGEDGEATSSGFANKRNATADDDVVGDRGGF